MNMLIDYVQKVMESHPRLKSWVWFFSLWMLGLFTVTLLTLPFKLLVFCLR